MARQGVWHTWQRLQAALSSLHTKWLPVPGARISSPGLFVALRASNI